MGDAVTVKLLLDSEETPTDEWIECEAFKLRPVPATGGFELVKTENVEFARELDAEG